MPCLYGNHTNFNDRKLLAQGFLRPTRVRVRLLKTCFSQEIELLGITLLYKMIELSIIYGKENFVGIGNVMSPIYESMWIIFILTQ